MEVCAHIGVTACARQGISARQGAVPKSNTQEWKRKQEAVTGLFAAKGYLQFLNWLSPRMGKCKNNENT